MLTSVLVLLDRAQFKSKYLAHGNVPSFCTDITVWGIYCKGSKPQRPQGNKRAGDKFHFPFSGWFSGLKKRDLIKYLKYLGPGQLAPFLKSRTLTSGHSTRVRCDRESGHWGIAERTPHALCPPAIPPTPLRFVISHQLKPWVFLNSGRMQELMALLTAHPSLALMALPVLPVHTPSLHTWGQAAFPQHFPPCPGLT